jgi:hypothetical protein
LNILLLLVEEVQVLITRVVAVEVVIVQVLVYL